MKRTNKPKGAGIVTAPFPMRAPDGAALHLAKDANGVVVAFASRLVAAPGETHPFKVWRAICGQGPLRPGDMVAVDYASGTPAGAVLSARAQGKL